MCSVTAELVSGVDRTKLTNDIKSKVDAIDSFPSETEKAVTAEEADGAKVAAGVPTRIGVVTHYFGRVGAGVIALDSGELRVGDTIHVRGHTTDFYQRVNRIEIDRSAQMAESRSTPSISWVKSFDPIDTP